eukprot:g4067.t1
MDLQVSKVLAATCNDPRHPPSNILNGDNSQFWSTTGLYPQEFILALDDASEVSRLKTFTTNVRHLVVERCEGSNPISWEKMFELEVADTDGRLQVESTRIQGQAIASYLKFKIMSGWDDFASVHHIALQGRPK